MKHIKVKNQVGFVSLVGFMNKEFPMSRGNYFSLGGFYVLNMWYENHQHLNLEAAELDAVQIGERHIILIDESIPEDYLNDEPCFTGGGGLSKESTKEVYDYMFSRFEKLKCLCCDTAQYVSVFIGFHRTQKAGISLSSGECRICDRKLFLNNNKEVDQETWDKLTEVHESAPNSSPHYLAPWTTELMGTIVVGDKDFNPKKGLLSRYAKKKVNSEFYGMIKIDDLKDEHKNNKE